MPAALKLEGKVFGKLLVSGRSPQNDKHGKALWDCFCDPAHDGCGNSIQVTSGSLVSGNTKSCGCLRTDTIVEYSTKHGLRYVPEYKTWRDIKERCYNEKRKDYHRYGGRGITMCDEWRDSFEAFYRDMGPRPTPSHSIDRRENDKGYYKDNCHWTTRLKQSNNRRDNLRFEYRGVIRTLAEWCRELKLSYYTLYRRVMQLGWTFEEAIQPIENLSITFDGQTKLLKDWCDLMDLRHSSTYLRILRGEDFVDIVKE